jgi:hypothetical protein
MKYKANKVFRAISKPFKKTAVLISLIGCLSTGCGDTINNHYHYHNPESPEAAQGDDTRNKGIELAENLGVSCNKMAEVEKAQFPNVDSAVLEKDQCTVYEINESKYLIKSEGSRLIIYDEAGQMFISPSLPLGKFFKITDELSVSVDWDWENRGPLKTFMHKIIPVEKIQVTAIDCDKYGSLDDCAIFLEDTKKLLRSIQKMSGKNMGECYNEIVYQFVEEDAGEAFSSVQGSGLIEIGGILSDYVLNAEIKSESHEPLHLFYHCFNLHVADSAYHFFWNPVSEQLNLAQDDVEEAQRHAKAVVGVIKSFESDPHYLDDYGDYRKCSEAQTYLMYKKYSSLTPTERKKFVFDFFQMISGDKRFLTDTHNSDSKALIDAVCKMSGSKDCFKFLRNYCNFI